MTSPDMPPQESYPPTRPIQVPPKKRRTGLIVGVAVGVLLAAAVTATIVVSVNRPVKPVADASAAPAAVVTTEAAPPKASVSQYASAVSPPIKSLRETYAQYNADFCAIKTTTKGDLACSILPITFSAESQTLAITLQGAVKPGVPLYIGEPPAEIERLVADTLSAAQDVSAKANSGDQPDPVAFSFALSSLMRVLDRWDPYM